ncbi:M50 family metallopeptidase [Butyrivibrio sp. MC2013]|uniref:M50 family metallopeptidase n=1 Tax=Butyrivibrio sp. MC2013 TaxID=1280686 RepID=UPI0003F6A859|nr:M50 family metallopeptidase [Butyrivibrio sp. MC2013]
MQYIIEFIIFLLIFALLVIFHEGGHFLIAKANGIRVHEFTVGMGPVLFKKKKGDTTYSVRLLPFGGACVFEGMDGGEIVRDENDEHSFRNAGVWKRIATVLAGPVANFILGYLLAVIVTSLAVWTMPVVKGFSLEDSPAREAGIMEGDLITSVNGRAVHQAAEVTMNLYLTDGEPVEVSYIRDGQEHTVTVTPSYYEDEEMGRGRYVIGIYIGEPGKIKGISTLKYAWYDFAFQTSSTWRALGLLVSGRTDKAELSGPVGMAQMVDESYTSAMDAGGVPDVILTMLNLAMFLSVNLGIMNLLPIPALDGGRFLFLLLELVRGKPIPEEKEGVVTMIGAVILILIMAAVMFKDIMKFF